jgi:serine phosphatase RsbU (regulator of sigma subunit)
VTIPGRLSSILGFLSAVAVLVVFVVAAFSIRSAIEQNLSFQRELRLSQVDRAHLLRLQIDEETGVRGYADTGMRLFLAPYTAALHTFGPASTQLDRRLPRLAVDETPLRDELDLNRRWLRTVAAPLIRNPGSHELVATQVEGKRLVDQFRATDVIFSNELDAAADIAETSTAKTVTETLVGAILLGVVLAGLLTWLSAVQRRLGFEVDLQRQAYLEEKRIADALQEAFLQKSLPDVARAELHAVYVPAGRESQVGGDWYDAFELVEDRILFSIGDVAGHGIEAAVVMSRVRQALLSVGIDEPDPAAVLSRANEILLMQDATIVTAICGVIDLSHGVIRLANAGHPPALVRLANGKIETIGATGPPLGALDRPSYTVASAWISPGSLLALYTDGLIEYGRDWDEGERRLLDALRAIPADAADPADALMREIFGTEPPFDDVAILTVSFRESLQDGGMGHATAADRVRPILGRSLHTLLASAQPMLTARIDS